MTGKAAHHTDFRSCSGSWFSEQLPTVSLLDVLWIPKLLVLREAFVSFPLIVLTFFSITLNFGLNILRER